MIFTPVLYNLRRFVQTRSSCFEKYQDLRVQELPDQVPVGHIPRTMTVVARGSVTRSVQPGDVVHIFGTFLPTPYTGFQAIKAGLAADTYLDAQHVSG
jgi:DNA replication licensing factor MCM7